MQRRKLIEIFVKNAINNQQYADLVESSLEQTIGQLASAHSFPAEILTRVEKAVRDTFYEVFSLVLLQTAYADWLDAASGLTNEDLTTLIELQGSPLGQKMKKATIGWMTDGQQALMRAKMPEFQKKCEARLAVAGLPTN